MANFVHKRNGQIITQPRNWEELEIEKDFLDRNDDVNINITSLEFAGEEAKSIRDRILSGLSGGLGVFEGEKYEIEVGEVGNPVYTFQGYLDYSENVEFIGCDGVVVALKKRQGGDWLNDVADGFSFRYLFDIGEITNADFIKVPYVINYIPDNVQLVTLAISLYMMTKELIESIKEIAEAVGDVIDAATPVGGVSAGAGFGIVTAWDFGNFVLVTIKLVARIAYTVAIVVAIINLMKEIIEQLLPKKRFHLGMSLFDLFRKGAKHLGLGFSSTLLTERNNWVVIPSKDHKGGQKPTGYVGQWTERGVPGANDGFDTFGDLIRVWSDALNADYRIINGVFHFERADFWDNTGNFIVPDFFTDQNELKDIVKLNVDEVISNYNINWAYDTQDQNTLDNQEGRIFQAILEPNNVLNRDLVSLKNLEEIGIPCSLGLRKEELTVVEKVLKALAKFVDSLTGLFGAGTNFAADIENRRGSLLLSSHFLTIPKVVVMQGSKLASNQRELLSARTLWDDLHFINSFVEINGIHNQYYRYENVRVPFCLKDFVNLLENNNCKTKNGDIAKIETLSWRVWEDYATITYRVRRKYTNNLSIKYIV